ncbi:Hypothetical predicted protein [Mytilus galloprovincialis]|uniref:Uncharacterized protein n=2 Tax=Mytilus galloprovincialis TaxID=29158 RepID=A0A8B6CE79_MYTGA|nr:Hypothetical predicted protein [Mytilus galloprovincialis]
MCILYCWQAGPSDRSTSSTNEMTVRRSRYSSVPPGYFASTKGHSALKRWSYAPQSRSALYEDTFIPEVIRPRSYYDTSREENDIRRGVNDELVYTSNLMDDTYDVAAKSRSRDQMLLRDAARALVDTETYVSPRSSVTSNRVRATSVVARPAPLTSRAVSCPPTSRRSNQPLYGGKSHWDEEGHVTKPKNLMSWKLFMAVHLFLNVKKLVSYMTYRLYGEKVITRRNTGFNAILETLNKAGSYYHALCFKSCAWNYLNSILY